MTRQDEIFDGKNFNDILRDIYKNSAVKDKQIKLLIGELRPLIKNVGDATILVPIIKDYLEVSIRNDEHIVKLASIVQRLIVNGGGDNESADSILSAEEKKQLLSEIDQLITDTSDVKADIKSVKQKLTPPPEETME